MNAAIVLVKQFWAICLLRQGPQEIPAAVILLVIGVSLQILISTILSLGHLSLLQAIPFSLLEVMILGSAVYGLLHLVEHPSRFTQTFTAMLGCSLLIELLTSPFVFWLVLAQQSESGMLLLPMIVVLASALWLLVIYGHILRHALEISLPMGLLTMFLISAVLGTLLNAFVAGI